MSKKLYIKTYGCQMNVYDSARMADVMVPLGYTSADTLEDADLVVLNTCHIREKAAEKVYSELGRLHKLQKEKAGQGERLLIAVAGCVGQAEGEEITRRMPFVDMVLGPQSYHRLPEMVNTVLHREGMNVIDLTFEGNDKFDALPEESATHGVSTFLSIQEGCDKFCTFCVVPYTRGAEYSRPVAAIVREAIHQVSTGSREITLLGQNVNAYHGEDMDGKAATLAGLIRQLAKIEKLERIRYTTSHPRDMSDDLIAAHSEEPKLMPFLHLPIQSGSDRILKMMNRRHTAAEYLTVVERLREARPDVALSSDFIVGFPGETEADFDNTMRLVERVEYVQAYSFTYSPRPGTPAADEEQLPQAVKEERLQRLQALLNAQQAEFNRRSVGQVMPVLFEREGKLPGQLIGKSPYLQSVHATDPSLRIGDIVNVEITRALGHSVSGKVLRDGLVRAA